MTQPPDKKSHPLANAPKAGAKNVEADLKYMRGVLPPTLIAVAVGGLLVHAPELTGLLAALLTMHLAVASRAREDPRSPAAKIEILISAASLIIVLSAAAYVALMFTCSAVGLGPK